MAQMEASGRAWTSKQVQDEGNYGEKQQKVNESRRDVEDQETARPQKQENQK